MYDYTVIGIYADNGQIFSHHTQAKCAMNAFAVVAEVHPTAEMVCVLDGHRHEDAGVTFPGTALVDADTILNQPEVFPPASDITPEACTGTEQVDANNDEMRHPKVTEEIRNAIAEVHGLAEAIGKAWNEKEAVDWSEAEQIVRQCQRIAKMYPPLGLVLEPILSYADSNEDWDSGVVARFPSDISLAIEACDKSYHYRLNGEDWEVYSLTLIGEEEWVSTVVTETVAELLVNILNPWPGTSTA